jgi:hypothetical protein
MNDYLDSINLEKKVKLGCIHSVIVDNLNKKLYGEILTICDASAKDVESRKAMKSLVSQCFSRISRNIMLEIDKIKEA